MNTAPEVPRRQAGESIAIALTSVIENIHAAIGGVEDPEAAFYAASKAAKLLRDAGDHIAIHRAMCLAQLAEKEKLSLAQLAERFSLSRSRVGQLMAIGKAERAKPTQ